MFSTRVCGLKAWCRGGREGLEACSFDWLKLVRTLKSRNLADPDLADLLRGIEDGGVGVTLQL